MLYKHWLTTISLLVQAELLVCKVIKGRAFAEFHNSFIAKENQFENIFDTASAHSIGSSSMMGFLDTGHASLTHISQERGFYMRLKVHQLFLWNFLVYRKILHFLTTHFQGGGGRGSIILTLHCKTQKIRLIMKIEPRIHENL